MLDTDLTVLPTTEAGWRELLLMVPGYDPFSSADEVDYFEASIAVKAIGFFHEYLTHIEGEVNGKPFVLERWQQAVIANLFGWMRKDGYGRTVRRYRELFLYVPRKNGKTPMVAGISNCVLYTDDEPGAMNLCAASDTEQATLLFRHASGMVRNNAELTSRTRIYDSIQMRSLVYNDARSSMKVISSDARRQHGFNGHFAAVDELHTQNDSELVDVIETSMASLNRKQPLVAWLTTADYMRISPCNSKYDYACKVRDGVVGDARFLPVIYEAGREDDWTDEATWRAANPNLDVSVSMDYLRRECIKAQEDPTRENTFRRLHLNQRTENDVRMIPLTVWDENSGLGGDTPREWRDRMERELAGAECVGGLDLAATSDISAFVLDFRRGDEVILVPWFWIPEDTAREREKRDRVPYLTWIREGWISTTHGNVTDFDVLRRDITEIGERFNVAELAFDRWGAAQIQTQLEGDGFTVVQFGQGYASMSPATKEFNRLWTGRRIVHGANPVLRWMAGNTAAEIDAAGNIKPSKKKSTERIDGIVASIMAVGRRCVMAESRPSVYETRGVIRL
jgi:phage terminase large subunit-like protein